MFENYKNYKKENEKLKSLLFQQNQNEKQLKAIYKVETIKLNCLEKENNRLHLELNRIHHDEKNQITIVNSKELEILKSGNKKELEKFKRVNNEL